MPPFAFLRVALFLAALFLVTLPCDVAMLAPALACRLERMACYPATCQGKQPGVACRELKHTGSLPDLPTLSTPSTAFFRQQ